MTKIEWADKVWNPISGCSKVSEGCRNCAAENVQLHPERELPLRWRKPRKIFVNSDLFHEQVPDDFVAEVWKVMRYATNHTFQILTKRPERMLQWFQSIHEWEGYMVFGDSKPTSYGGKGIIVGEAKNWPLPYVWLGVSIENQQAADERIPLLLQTPAAVRFVSCEPLLGPVNVSPFLDQWECQFCHTKGFEKPSEESEHTKVFCKKCEAYVPYQPIHTIDWVIVGGESGPGARPMHPDWVRGLRDQCQEAGVPFFFKGFGEFCPADCEHAEWWVCYDGKYGRWSEGDPPHGKAACINRVGKKKAGRLLDGHTWDEFPEVPEVEEG